jgi:hypothetical protein
MALAFSFLFPALVNYYSPPFFVKKKVVDVLRACVHVLHLVAVPVHGVY